MKTVIVLLTFTAAIMMAFSCSQGSEGKIGLVPLGDIGEEELEYLRHGLREVFGLEIDITPGFKDLEFAYNPERHQYHSTPILRKLASLKDGEDYQKVLGIVDVDLYVPELNFVFGEALGIEGKFAVIALTRLRQEFYGLKPDSQLFQERALKEAVHELGHLWGLGHCSDHQCVMHFSNSLKDTDGKSWNFCSRCRKRLDLAF